MESAEFKLNFQGRSPYGPEATLREDTETALFGRAEH